MNSCVHAHTSRTHRRTYNQHRELAWPAVLGAAVGTCGGMGASRVLASLVPDMTASLIVQIGVGAAVPTLLIGFSFIPALVVSRQPAGRLLKAP